MNNITIHGRLVADPVLRSNDEYRVAEFAVAVNRRYKRDKTDFFEVKAWGGLADVVMKTLAKGREVIIGGEMQSRRYEKDGVNHIRWELSAEWMEFCGKKSDNEQQERASELIPVSEEDSDLPF